MNLKEYGEVVNETASLLFQVRTHNKSQDTIGEIADQCFKDAVEFADAGCAAGFVQPDNRRGRK